MPQGATPAGGAKVMAQMKNGPRRSRFAEGQQGRTGQALTLSFSALAIENFTCLSAGFVIVSPVAGLRT